MSLRKLMRRVKRHRRAKHYIKLQDCYKTVVRKLKKRVENEKNEEKREKRRLQYAKYIMCIHRFQYEIDFNGFESVGRTIETINIPNGTVSFNLSALLGKYCNSNLSEVIIFLRDVNCTSHLEYFLYVVQLLHMHCDTLEYVKLKCQRDGGENSTRCNAQANLLRDFKRAWPLPSVKCNIEVVSCAVIDYHKIFFNNGFVFKFEKGFQPMPIVYKNELRYSTATKKIIIWTTNVLDLYNDNL